MGLDVLLDAWSELEGVLPEGSTLLLVGDGPLREQLSERAARSPLAGRVRVLGRVSDAELIDAYRAADVAVVPTIALEGYGLVVLEAAACGTPSVVSDVGGLAEAALELDRSLLVAPGDAGRWRARLQQAAGGQLPAASVAALRRGPLLDGGGRPPPRPVPLAAQPPARPAPAGGVPRPRRPAVRRGDPAQPPVAPPAAASTPT